MRYKSTTETERKNLQGSCETGFVISCGNLNNIKERGKETGYVRDADTEMDVWSDKKRQDSEAVHQGFSEDCGNIEEGSREEIKLVCSSGDREKEEVVLGE